MAFAFRDILKSRLLTPAGIGSILAHTALLVLIIWGTGVRPFQNRTEAITVELVTPDQIKVPTPDPFKEEPKPDFDLKLNTQPLQTPATSASSQAPLSPPPQPPAQQQAAAPASASSASEIAPTPEPAPPQATLPSPTPPAPTAPPDITDKYGTLFSPLDATFDPDKATAKLPPEAVEAFREHLKTCSALPSQVSPKDRVRIVLRVGLLPNGNLASTPALIEASASPKGPFLMQAAIKALQACQPHNTLPQDQYSEWKLLDLPFTPADFTGK